jgi:glutamate-1-semialdehyde 2,1-aminomutase
MAKLSERFEAGVQEGIDAHALPWSVSRLGARTEYRFANPAPRDGTESAAAGDTELEDFLHLYLANRGILLTSFHNMALMCPDTTERDVDTHTRVFDAALGELTG